MKLEQTSLFSCWSHLSLPQQIVSFVGRTSHTSQTKELQTLVIKTTVFHSASSPSARRLMLISHNYTDIAHVVSHRHRRELEALAATAQAPSFLPALHPQRISLIVSLVVRFWCSPGPGYVRVFYVSTRRLWRQEKTFHHVTDLVSRSQGFHSEASRHLERYLPIWPAVDFSTFSEYIFIQRHVIISTSSL